MLQHYKITIMHNLFLKLVQKGFIKYKMCTEAQLHCWHHLNAFWQQTDLDHLVYQLIQAESLWYKSNFNWEFLKNEKNFGNNSWGIYSTSLCGLVHSFFWATVHILVANRLCFWLDKYLIHYLKCIHIPALLYYDRKYIFKDLHGVI